MKSVGKHYERLSVLCDFNLISYYLKKSDFEHAYEIANKTGGNQAPRELTLYLLKEYDVFKVDPLSPGAGLNYVPRNFLYEAVDKDLCIFIPETIKEIQDFAFRYASIQKLIISTSVERIGESALCLNDGEIEYMGTKETFISKFLGKSNCFLKTKGQHIRCADGDLVIKK